MPDLLLELFSEEIPARMQAQAARDLERLTIGALTDRGFLFEGIKAFAGPRRLTLAIAGLPAQQGDVREELKGPKVDAPQAALDGFLKKTGLTKEHLTTQSTPKGDVYMAVIERKGRDTPLVLAEIFPEIFAKFPWPKSMRWPYQRKMTQGGAMTGGMVLNTATPNQPPAFEPVVRWVRPLRSILCTFDGEVVPFSFAGIQSGNTTMGHRFLSPGAIEVRRFEDYEAALKKAHVVLDAAERAEIISHDLKQKAFALGLEVIEDAGLLAEVSGLAEWPTVLVGTIEDQFMDVPPEILQTAMRTHQKYFSLSDPKTGKMANRFALVANMTAADGGREIVAGNERVLRARLSDAKFFWDEDRKHTLESRVEKLKGIVFHAKLGTQYERVERIVALAGKVAPIFGADVAETKRAAFLSKADLTTGVVGEFPELQGVMGRYYALDDKEDAAVADAVRDHYRPVGPSDAVPTDKVAIAVALADKLDQLAGFFAINETPTGSSDPFALRRAALGLIRIILENRLSVSLGDICFDSVSGHMAGTTLLEDAAKDKGPINRAVNADLAYIKKMRTSIEKTIGKAAVEAFHADPNFATTQARILMDRLIGVAVGMVHFIADRFKVALKEKGIRHDLIDAVFSLGGEDDLVRLVARVEALQVFLKTDDGKNLLAGYKRAANILKAEEKRENRLFGGEVLESALSEPAEKSLFTALAKARAAITPALEQENFAAAMQQMASLRVPVDAFFESVKVNADDAAVRENRLNLLASLRATLHQVADFSKIEG